MFTPLYPAYGPAAGAQATFGAGPAPYAVPYAAAGGFWPVAYAADRLTPMETLMLHELLVSQTAQLLDLRGRLEAVENETLKAILGRMVQLLEKNIRETIALLQRRAVFPA
ncbi:hypothetical protein [Hydrogenibacillus sp. N12]|uniref:hypothetical protein n=1 Tax=Hydrogenibacillus sp. N12 TaxID=2866627 RepID=UPI001C7E0316|nr:hypothetical protein [Hydrogenibacillus sp. N12]QZA32099.1 hypothetical protein K2M58_07045 [Hydrogenibacillus sp. N12]